MTVAVKSLRARTLKRSREGHRTYKVLWYIQNTNKYGGPAAALTASGLPTIGSSYTSAMTSWSSGTNADTDDWAFCTPEAQVQMVRDIPEGSPGEWWSVEQTFTTEPLQRDQTASFENPVSEPWGVGGNFVKYQKLVDYDRNGNLLITSSFEKLADSFRERDFNRHSVWFEKNFSTLPLATYVAMIDTLNDATLWGLPKRCVKLSNVSWERKYYGSNFSNIYYTVRYEFDIDFETFDKEAVNVGTKCLMTHSPGEGIKDVSRRLDPLGEDPEIAPLKYYQNPKRFVVYKDEHGENTPCFLDAYGRPVAKASDALLKTVELYGESNLLLLGIPSTF